MKLSSMLLLLVTMLAAKSIPQGYTSAIPADIFIKPHVKSHIGMLNFDDAVADEESRKRIQNEYVYIEMVRSYFENYKAVWLEILRKELIDAGVTPNKTLVSNSSMLRSKTLLPKIDPTATYTIAVLDLSKEAIALQLPANTNKAIVIDAWGEKVSDIEPQKRYIIDTAKTDINTTASLQNDQNATYIQTSTKIAYLFATTLGENNETDTVFHPLQVPTAPRFVDLAKLDIVVLAPKSARFFKLLDDVAKREEVPAKKRSLLSAIGIKHDTPFDPPGDLRPLYNQAALMAAIIAKQNPSLTSLNMLLQLADTEKTELTKDVNGEYLQGEKSYTIHIDPKTAAQEWSLTLYDMQTSALMQNRFDTTPYIVSSSEDLIKNSDGSLDIFLTPNQQNDSLVGNTVKTVPKKNYFAIFRLYRSEESLDTNTTITIEPLKERKSTEQEENIEVY